MELMKTFLPDFRVLLVGALLLALPPSMRAAERGPAIQIRPAEPVPRIEKKKGFLSNLFSGKTRQVNAAADNDDDDDDDRRRYQTRQITRTQLPPAPPGAIDSVPSLKSSPPSGEIKRDTRLNDRPRNGPGTPQSQPPPVPSPTPAAPKPILDRPSYDAGAPLTGSAVPARASSPAVSLTPPASVAATPSLSSSVAPIIDPTPTLKPPVASVSATPPAEQPPPSAPPSPPVAKPVPGRPGYVYHPGWREIPQNIIDVTGYAPGTKVRDPHTGVVFLVP